MTANVEEVIHFVSKSRNRSRDLLFDSELVKDEYRSDFNKLLKTQANFFKHADRDPDGSIEFDARASDGFVLFAIIGLDAIGEPLLDGEAAFMFWRYFHNPEQLTEAGRKRFVESIPADVLTQIRSIPRDEFFDGFTKLRWMERRLAADRAKFEKSNCGRPTAEDGWGFKKGEPPGENHPG